MDFLPGFQDLCLAIYQQPPVTFRDCDVVNGAAVEQDPYLNPKSDLCCCQRLDYALWLSTGPQANACVNVMKITSAEHPFLKKMSDHSAMEINVLLR